MFFLFKSKLLSTTIQAAPIEIKFYDQLNDDHSKLIRGNYTDIDLPVVFKQEYGKKYLDILDTGFPNLYLISNNLMNILTDNLFTGWKTYPIVLLDKKANNIQGYHGFSVIGRSGPRSFINSKIVEKPAVLSNPNSSVHKYYVGFEIKDWDGSDFFLSLNYGAIIISERVAGVLKDHKISNLQIEPICDYEIDVSYIKGV